MKIGIAAKIIIFTILLNAVAVVFLSFYFVRHEIREIYISTDRIGNAVVKNLADSCEWSVLSNDSKTLEDELKKLLQKEKDVVYARITTLNGKTITQTGNINPNSTKIFSAPITTISVVDSLQQMGAPQNNEKLRKLIGSAEIRITLVPIVEKITRTETSAALIALILLVISSLGIFAMIHFFISRPLIPLLKGIALIGSGDFRTRINVKAGDEMGKLAQAFNAMTDVLSSTHVSRDYLNRIIQLMFNGLIVANTNGTIIMANAAASEMLGYGDLDMNGMPLNAIFAGDSIALSDLAKMHNQEKNCLAKDGRILPVIFSASPMHNNEGLVDRWICVIQDIAERKHYETKLQDSARELQRSNKELEQFAYVISHDLKEPLRMVSSYVLLLKKRYESKLDSDADEFINYAMDGALRMQNLIDALLTYARIGTSERPLTQVNCEEIFTDITTNLSIITKERNAIITHDPLPTVTTDKILLSQVIQNLINNAIKFNKTPEPKIHLGIADKGRQWLFSVKDNGIGIDAKHMDRIFIMFKRLHSREEYPGTGIGLALCKKIVENFGGTIRVESEVGKGSCFYFTIPK